MNGLGVLLPAKATADVGRVGACAIDTIEQVPPCRWAVVAGAVDFGATRHGGFVYGADLIDAGLFGLSPAETAAMDPQQRLVLERGYEALHAAGLDRAQLGGSLTGVFLGLTAMEYAQLLAASPAGGSVYAATGSAHSIASGRLSYVLGLHGASAAYDSACSAALVACHAAVRALQRGECAGGLAAGINLMLLPGVGVSFARAGMTSPQGRSFTFDARADGYARGEACAAGALVATSTRGASAAAPPARVRGCAVRQDGRSASLTAPNGQAQQGLLRAAFGEAATSADEIGAAEFHGTGMALGDPIEAGAFAGAVLSCRLTASAPLAVGGVKANIGHAEPAAGMTGLVRLLAGLARGAAPPNAQLRVLNVHIRGMRFGGSGVMITQLAALDVRLCEGSGHPCLGAVSSFGYSGTIAHAVLRSYGQVASSGPSLADCNLPSAAPPASLAAECEARIPVLCPEALFRRRHFPWSESSHPLLQQCLEQVGSLVSFRSPAAGRVHSLVAEHVVHGRVVFPGAAYLEMARAACWAAASSGTAMTCLQAVFFLQPLAIEDGADGAALLVECEVRDGSSFKVRSGDEAALQGGATPLHCSGTASQAAAPPLEELAGAVARRSCCDRKCSLAAQYEGFHVVGLQYGPAYRLLRRAWAGGQRDGRVLWRGAVA